MLPSRKCARVRPATVMIGTAAALRVCRQSTRRVLAPMARAVRTKSEARTLRTAERVYRARDAA